MSKSLDAFQTKSLREILQRPSSFEDRRYTSQKILGETTSIAFPALRDTRKIIRFREYDTHRRAKLLGHILRSSNDDPGRFYLILLQDLIMEKNRVGKPRQNWLHHRRSFANERILRHHNSDELTDDECVYAAAMNRFFLSARSLTAPTPCIKTVRSGRRRKQLGKISAKKEKPCCSCRQPGYAS